jgi:hypothetical protein
VHKRSLYSPFVYFPEGKGVRLFHSDKMHKVVNGGLNALELLQLALRIDPIGGLAHEGLHQLEGSGETGAGTGGPSGFGVEMSNCGDRYSS